MLLAKMTNILLYGISFNLSGDWTRTTTPNVEVAVVEDVNNDWQARLSNGTSFGYNGNWTNTTNLSAQFVGINDLNNDGFNDLILQFDRNEERH